MDLDGAIRYYSHLADECRRKANIERYDYMDLKDLAAEHGQLADWLNELKVLREKIRVLLEKQEQARWIPVTERLPEVGQSVMITVGGIYTAEGCLKDDGNWCQFRWSAEHKPAIVGAWKPLPEPYTEEES